MTTGPGHSKRRVFVAIDDTSETDVVIDTAAHLAASLSAELTGVLIEQPDLLDAARLPVTSVVSFRGESISPYDILSLKRSLRLRAQKIERQFVLLAEKLKVPCQFSTGNVAVLDDTISALTHGDIFAIGLSHRDKHLLTTILAHPSTTSEADCSVLVIRKARVSPGSVVVVSSDHSDNVALGAGLAQTKGRSLYVLPVIRDPNTRAIDTPTSLPARGRRLPAVTIDGLLEMLDRAAPAYLVIDRTTLRVLNIAPEDISERLKLDGLVVTGSSRGNTGD